MLVETLIPYKKRHKDNQKHRYIFVFEANGEAEEREMQVKGGDMVKELIALERNAFGVQ